MKVNSQMQHILADFVPVLQAWTKGHENRLIDGYETDYAENYAPALAVVIYASVYTHDRDPDILSAMHAMFRRTLTLLEDRRVSPFCRVFLHHYSLLGMLFLPEDERNECIQKYGASYQAYVDDCDQVNTNCAALQLGTEWFTHALGFRKADASYMNDLLRFLEQSQNQLGFINDDVTHTRVGDGMPIAYHAFTIFILTSILAMADHWDEAYVSCKNRMEAIIRIGSAWLKHSISPDGTFAMIGRSSYQMFTWGTLVTYLSGFAVKQAEDNVNECLSKALHDWLQYKHSDQTFSCAPNHFPHGLRIGFESYTHVNMYNGLGMAGIAVAERIMSQRYQFDMDYGFSSQGKFLDQESGYAFFRDDDCFFACTLRAHSQHYSLAMQGFHFRIKDTYLPLAEPKLDPNELGQLRGLWEGYLLEDAEGGIHYSDTRSNARVVFLDHGVSMTWDDPYVFGGKWIRISEQKIEWEYRIAPKNDLTLCQHVLPVLISDGLHENHFYQEKQQRIRMEFAGKTFYLQCAHAQSAVISKKRSFVSPSGVGSLAYFTIQGDAASNDVIQWKTELIIGQ